MADADKKLSEKAALKIVLGTDAMSRFTRTPISIENTGHIDDMIAAFKKLGINAHVEGGPVQVDPANFVTGEYNPEDKRSRVTVNTANPSLEDIRRTLFHEDIHAALDRMGYTYPTIESQGFATNVNLSEKAAIALAAGLRAGNYGLEGPAYVGAYSPTQMPGFTEADRQVYLAKLQQTMQPGLAQLFSRIVSNYSANPSASFGPLTTQGQGQ